MVEMGQGVEPAVQIGEYGTRAAEGFLFAGVFGLLEDDREVANRGRDA